MGKIALIALLAVSASSVALAQSTTATSTTAPSTPQAAAPQTPAAAEQAARAQTASNSSVPSVTVIAPKQHADMDERLQETCRWGYHNGELMKVCSTQANNQMNRDLTHRDVFTMQQRALTSNHIP